MDQLFDFVAAPQTFWITVNRACNFRCRWCYAKDSGYVTQAEMSLERAKQIVDLGVELGVKQAVLMGGEPTLWAPLVEFNQYCAKKGFNSGISTNAYRFGDDNFWEQYLQNPSDSMNVSIKGVTHEHFAKMVGVPEALEQTLLGIERVLGQCADSCASTVFNNLVEVEDIVQIATTAKELGAKYFRLVPCTVTLAGDEVDDSYVVPRAKIVPALMQLQPILDDLYNGECVFEFNLPLCWWPSEFIDQLFAKHQIMSTCHVQDRSGLVFDTNGDILPCNGMLGAHIAKPGVDFHDAKSLLAHLNSAVIREEYKELLRYPSEECSRCNYRNRCRGGCILNWMVLEPQTCQAM